MNLQSLIEQSYDAFLQVTANTKVILLHPRSRYRTLLIAHLVNHPDVNTVYYAMGMNDVDVSSFLSGITHDVADQFPTFGRHLHMLPQSAYANMEVLLETFAKDLADVSSQPYYFILDEYDRSDSADDVQQFVERITQYLPPNCTLVINSRTLPRLPWLSMIAQRRALLLEDQQLISTDFYGIETSGAQKLEVYALGPGQVMLNGSHIDAWEGHLPRLLFFFALDRPVITRSEICQAFWPELDIDQAVNVFHVTKRRLHKALDMDVLVHDDGYYRVNPEMSIRYDINEFVSALMDGRNDYNPRRLYAWQRAVDLYRGPFLQGHTDRWIADRRKDFQSGYLEALTAMAANRLSEDRPEHALGLLQRAVTEDFHREDIHRQIMTLYQRLGRRSEVAAHYQRLLEDLRREEREPEPDTQAIYSDIMA